MRRIGRVVILAGSIFAAPLPAEVQQAGKVPRIGFLQGTQNESSVAFIQALQDAEYLEERLRTQGSTGPSTRV
jgi:hypothetical protein